MVRLKGLGKLKIVNDLIGTRTRDLQACSIGPEPSTVPRAPQECRKEISWTLCLTSQNLAMLVN
jgi:hypothetical protein